jgi:cell division protein FtsW (lipid II flippase)
MDGFLQSLLRFSQTAIFVAPAALLVAFLVLQWLGESVRAWLGKALRWLTAPVVIAAPGLCAALLLSQRPAEPGVNVLHEGVAIVATDQQRPREILIGGVTEEGRRSADDLLLPGLAPDSLRLLVEGGSLRARRGPGDASGDVLVKQGARLVSTDGETPRAVPLAAGDVIRGADGAEVVFSQGGWLGSAVTLAAGSHTVTLENRKTRVPQVADWVARLGLPQEISLYVFQPWTRKLHPLSALPPCAAWRSAVGFGFGGQDTNAATLIVRDRGMTVVRGGAPIAHPASQALDGLFFEQPFEILSPVLPRDSEAPGVAQPERWRTVARFEPRLEQQDKELLLHLALPSPRATRIALAAPVEPEKMHVVSVMDPLGFARHAPGLRLDMLGEKFQAGHADMRFAAGDFSRFEVMGQSLKKLTTVPAGELFHTGGDFRAGLRVKAPWASAERVLAVLAATALSLVAWWRFMGCAARTALAAGLGHLLMARVVFAQAAEVNVPFDATAFPVALNLMFGLPVFVAGVDACCRRLWSRGEEDGRGWRKLVSVSAIVVLLAGFAMQLPASRNEQLRFAVSLAGPLAIGCLLLWVPAGDGFLRAAAARAARWVRESSDRSFFSLAFGMLALLVLARIGALLIGWKEAITLGGGTRIALSIFFTPFYLMLCCLGLARLVERCRRGAGRLDMALGILFQAALLGSAGAMYFAVSDLGAVIFSFPLVLLIAGVSIALALSPGRVPGWRGGLRPAAALFFFAIVPIGLLGALFFSPVLLPPLNKLGLEPDEFIVSGEQVSAERNKLRMLASLDRGKLEMMGSNIAEETVQVMALMRNYSLRGWTGEGFLNVPVHRIMAPVAENDNCAAIYLLGQFGTLGACGLCVAYLAFLLPSLRGSVGTDASVARVFGSLTGTGAALTLAGTSLYMIAANLQLVPFTGRNMMLLSLNSLSDPLEAMATLALIFFGVAAAENARGPATGVSAPITAPQPAPRALSAR